MCTTMLKHRYTRILVFRYSRTCTVGLINIATKTPAPVPLGERLSIVLAAVFESYCISMAVLEVLHCSNRNTSSSSLEIKRVHITVDIRCHGTAWAWGYSSYYNCTIAWGQGLYLIINGCDRFYYAWKLENGAWFLRKAFRNITVNIVWASSKSNSSFSMFLSVTVFIKWLPGLRGCSSTLSTPP